MCVFRENLEEICDELNNKPKDIDNIFYSLNKFFTLLHRYWGFGQPDKEKYHQLYNHLNFSLPGVMICRCTWGINEWNKSILGKIYYSIKKSLSSLY